MSTPPPPPGFTLDDEPPRAPRALRSDPPPPPPGFRLDDPASLAPTGAVHDGDTFRTKGGVNARLFGVDAFELNQNALMPSGGKLPIGVEARNALLPFAQPGATVTPTGGTTYGRPVVSLDNGGDAGASLLRQGWGLTAPEYLRGDPARLAEYKEAERLARLNQLGAHGNSFATPAAARAGNGSPWAEAEFRNARQAGDTAVFFDEPTPFQGLRPEDERGYLAIWTDPKRKPEDLIAFATQRGFGDRLNPEDVRKRYAERDKGRKPEAAMNYATPPKLTIDAGDGATGAALRGYADPINFLDEMGGVVDTLGLTPGRENLFNSDRRFGDVLSNNTEQNRAILAYDEQAHPWWRFGGQLASGLTFPGLSAEGVGLTAARAALKDGASRFVAEQAAKGAVQRRLGVAGAVEGGAAGIGGGETWQERAAGGVIGVPVGGALGLGVGAVAPIVAKAVGKPFSAMVGREAERSADDFADGATAAGKTEVQDTVAMPRAATPEARADLQPFMPELMRIAGRGPEVEADVRATLDRVGPDYPVAQAVDDIRARHDSPEPYSLTPPQQPIRMQDGREVYPRDLTGLSRADLEELAATAPREREVDEGVVTREQAAELLREHQDYGAFDDANLVDVIRRTLIEQRSPIWLKRVQEGTAHTGEQAAAIRLMGAIGALRDRGKWLGALAPELKANLVSRGWSAADADEVLSARLENLGRRELAAPTADDIPPPPPGYTLDEPGTAAMASEFDAPTLVGPDLMRTPDRIDVNGQPRPLMRPATDMERLNAAERVRPGDVVPLPSSAVDSLDEAARIDRGRYEAVRAPNEADALTTRNLPSSRVATRTIKKRGPLDLVTFLRTQGGLKPQGGELAHYGIDNAPRAGLDLAGPEAQLGKLVDPAGLGYDEAAYRAWEAGYFPDHAERPTVQEFLAALGDTYNGSNRRFSVEDADELAGYEAAREQRWAVEQAQDAGAPLTVDRSQPVDLADMDANAAPVQAYEEWGDNAPSLAGNLRLDKLDSPQAIKRAIVTTHQKVGGFDAATRGRITQAETERLASELGMTADDLLKRQKGQTFNAEQALAARQILARSATDLVNMAKRIQRADNPGDEVEAAFKEAWLRHVAIQEQIAGMTAEAGRALAQFRQVADGRLANRALPSLGNIAGGTVRIKDAADMILDLERIGSGPGKFSVETRRALQPKWKGRFVELYINSLLSGPQTHAVNIASNTLTALMQIPEQAAAATIGAGRKFIAGKRAAPERVFFSEISGRTAGLIQGTREGLREAARSFRTGDSSDHVSKVEGARQEVIGGVLGKIIRTPTRLLTAEDELFKGMARRMELTGLAIRKAKIERLKGDDFTRRVAELVANPDDEMLNRSFDYARYMTFQQPLQGVWLDASRATENSVAAKIIAPFVRTPVNLLKFSLERSPAAFMVKQWRKDMAAGGVRRDVAIARSLVGTGIFATFLQAALEGKVTGGGPADDEARRLMIADGWQPYSIKVGDTYYSYQRMDPYSTLLGTAADFVDLGSHMTDKQREHSTTLIVAAIMSNLSSKTFLSGISAASEALADPERSAANFVSRTAASMAVPALVSQTARYWDPVMREARGPIDRIRSRIPGVSESLPARRDAFGQEMRSEGGLGPDIFSPLWMGTARNDPTVKALLDAGAKIPAPSRKIGGQDLTPAEYSRYAELTGTIAKPQLDALVKTPDWLALPNDDKREQVEKLMRKARESARAGMMGSRGTPPPPPGFTLDPR